MLFRSDPPITVDIDYLYRAAKYVEKAFKLFDEKTAIRVDVPSAFDVFVQALERLNEKNSQDLQTANETSNEDGAG